MTCLSEIFDRLLLIVFCEHDLSVTLNSFLCNSTANIQWFLCMNFRRDTAVQQPALMHTV